MAKREFKVGEKVRIYGHKSADWMPIVGTVTTAERGGITDDGMNLAVDCGVRGIFFAHPKQCRRIKPKPEPVPENKPEARRVWLYDGGVRELDTDKSTASTFAKKVMATRYKPENDKYLEFREVLPGEVVVTQKDMADAWIALTVRRGKSSGLTVSDLWNELAGTEKKWGET